MHPVKDINDNDFSYLSNKYDLVGRYKALLDRIQSAIKGMDLQSEVHVNEDLLGEVVIDYFEDIDRLKEFEGIDHTKTSKICAYETYWLIKRKPIQAIKSSSDKNNNKVMYVNEIICTIMAIVKMHEDVGAEIREGDECLAEFVNLLCYNLKYRKFTQQSLELMIEAFYIGVHAGKADRIINS